MPDIEQVNEGPTTGESSILTAVKTALHITDNDMDDELGAYIAEALEDMRRVGVTAAVDSTEVPIVIGCAVTYVKYQTDYLGQGERFYEHYKRQRDSLSQGSDYNAEG